MGMINKRLFGSPIPEKVQKKLEDRQTLADEPKPQDTIFPIFPRPVQLHGC